MYYSTSSGRIELKLTKAQTQSASHPGDCAADVRALSQLPAIQRQLSRIEPELLKAELREWGAWDDVELADHEQNLQRLLWIAAGDIAESAKS